MSGEKTSYFERDPNNNNQLDNDVGGFNYINQLRQFVDDGFTNMKFVDSVSGIVSQGCHKPPCIEGATFRREERRTRFIKVMKMLGFSVPQNNEESM